MFDCIQQEVKVIDNVEDLALTFSVFQLQTIEYCLGTVDPSDFVRQQSLNEELRLVERAGQHADNLAVEVFSMSLVVQGLCINWIVYRKVESYCRRYVDFPSFKELFCSYADDVLDAVTIYLAFANPKMLASIADFDNVLQQLSSTMQEIYAYSLECKEQDYCGASCYDQYVDHIRSKVAGHPDVCRSLEALRSIINGRILNQ